MADHDENELLKLSTREIAKRHDKLPHDSYYYTGFWGSYKGYVKGALGGLLMGALLGGIIGLGAIAAAGIAVAFGAAPIAGGLAALIGPSILGGSFLGAVMGYHEFATIGSNAGVGVALDEMEIRSAEKRNVKDRNLLRSIAMLVGGEDRLPEVIEHNKKLNHLTDFQQANGNSHSDTPHMDAATSTSKKFFHWRVGFAGLLIGVGFGALMLAAAPALAAIPFLSAFVTAGHGAVHGGAMISALLTMTGLFGASFGVNRAKSLRVGFEITDRIFAGELFAHSRKSAKKGPAIETTPEISQTASIKSNAVEDFSRITLEEAKQLEDKLRPRDMPDRWKQIEAAKRQFAAMNPGETMIH